MILVLLSEFRVAVCTRNVTWYVLKITNDETTKLMFLFVCSKLALANLEEAKLKW